jgi:hypothetical protein
LGDAAMWEAKEENYFPDSKYVGQQMYLKGQILAIDADFDRGVISFVFEGSGDSYFCCVFENYQKMYSNLLGVLGQLNPKLLIEFVDSKIKQGGVELTPLEFDVTNRNEFNNVVRQFENNYDLVNRTELYDY